MNGDICADAARLLEHLDELIKEQERILSEVYARGDVRSKEFARHRGMSTGLSIARCAVADWIEEKSREG